MLLTADDVIKKDDKYYFVPLEFAALCYASRDGDVNIVDTIPGESILMKDSYSKIIPYEDEFYLIPKNGKMLHSYNVKSGEWKSFDVCEQGILYKFMDALIYDKKLIMIGCVCPQIIIFDFFSGKISTYEKIYEEYHDLYMKRQDVYFRRGHWEKNGKIYLASSVINEIVEFDVQSLKHKRYIVGRAEDLFDGLLYSENSLWLSPRNKSEIVRWEIGEEYKYVSLLSEENETSCLYLEPVEMNDLIMFPAFHAKYTLYFDKQGNLRKKAKKKYTVVKRFGEAVVSISQDGKFEELSYIASREKTLKIKNGCVLKHISEYDCEYLRSTATNETEIFNLDWFLLAMEKCGINNGIERKGDK